jgi:predicted GH43/DUF377 family glycosyl hydrolase
MNHIKIFEECSGSNPLFDEGKKSFPKLQEIGGRYYLNYPKNKGSFSEEGFKTHLTSHKIVKIVQWLKDKGILVNYSKSTMSVYFSWNGKYFRISNHGKKAFEGFDILVDWSTDIDSVVNRVGALAGELPLNNHLP